VSELLKVKSELEKVEHELESARATFEANNLEVTTKYDLELKRINDMNSGLKDEIEELTKNLSELKNHLNEKKGESSELH